MTPKPSKTHIPPEIWGISLANMLVAISTTMTFSVSPFFITSVLGISMLSLGALEGFTEALSQISKLFSGVVSDYTKKKKPTLLFGVLLTIISKPFFILAHSAFPVVISKILERLSNGIIATPRDAYVASIATPRSRGTCYGIIMSSKTIGCIIGPVFISVLTFFTENYHLLLWAGFFPCTLAILVLWFYMPEKEEDSLRGKEPKERFSFKEALLLPSTYWSLVVISALFMMARFNDGFLALRLKELGAPTYLSMGTVAIFNAVSTLCCLPMGWFADRLDRVKLLYFSYASLFLANLFCFLADSLGLMLLGIIFWGAQRGTSQLLFNAIIADIAPRRMIGTAIGLFYIIIGVMALFAGSLGGFIADSYALRGAFVYGLALSSVASCALLVYDYIRTRGLKKDKQVANNNQAEFPEKEKGVSYSRRD